MSPGGAAKQFFERRILLQLLLFAAAFSIRAWHVLSLQGDEIYGRPVVDALSYHKMAAALACGEPTPEPLFWQPVFYPIWLSLVYRLFGVAPLAARLIQAAIGSAVCALMPAAGRAWGENRAGWIAGVICAFCGPLIFYETDLMPEGWAVVLLAVFLCFVAPSTASPASFLLAGIAAGLEVANRPIVLPAMMVVWCGSLILMRSMRRIPRGRVAACLGCSAAGFALVAGALALAKGQCAGRAGILPDNGGINFYLANNENWRQTACARPGAEWNRILRFARENGAVSVAERDIFFRRKAWEYFRASPMLFLKGIAIRLHMFLCGREIPRNVDLYEYRVASPPLAALAWRIGGFGFPFGVLWPLAAAGAVVAFRRVGFPFAAMAMAFATGAAFFPAAGRYRIMIAPAVAVMAAVGAEEIARAIRERFARRVACGLSVFAVVFLLSAFPAHLPEERSPEFFRAELMRLAGLEKFESGAGDFGESLFRRAADLAPDDAETLNYLACALARMGRKYEALGFAKRAVAVSPDEPACLANLANLLMAGGRPAEAEVLLLRAITLDHGTAELRINLGLCLAKQGRYAEAIEQFEEGLRLCPGHPLASRFLAAAREEAGTPRPR